MTPSRRGALAAYALGVAGVALAAWASVCAPGHRVAPYLAGHDALLVASLIARRAVDRSDDPAAALRALVAVGIALRVALVPVAPFTTTDVGRYLWDGAVALGGHDPYALHPDAPALDALRATFPPPTDHRDVATCYPPLALALFALAASLGARALLGWKLLCLGASVLTARIAADACARERRHGDAALALLGPVTVLEAGVGAHLDAFVALAVVAMVAAAQRARWNLAALAAGCVVALKLVPGVVALPLLVRAPQRLWFVALAGAPVALSFGAAELLGMTPPGSLPAVAQHWSFGAPIWAALYARFPFDDEVIRPALALAGLAVITLISLCRRDIARAVAGCAGASLAASPVLYPWYATSLSALAALRPRAWAVAAVAAMPLSYEVLDGFHARGVWEPARWPMVALTLATLAGLAWDLRRDRRAR